MFVVQGSSRANGNTELLTKVMLEGMEVETVQLRDKKIFPIFDKRHDEEGFPQVDDDFAAIVERMLLHDQIVLTTPLYWYGMSGHLKNFVDRWSQALRVPELDFKERMKGKQVYVVIVGGRDARVKALPLVQQFQLICNFLELSFVGYVIGEAAKPGDIMHDHHALDAAAVWNRRLKENG